MRKITNLVRNKAGPKVKTLIKISTLIFLLYKLKIISKEKILKLINKVIKKKKDKNAIFERLERLGIPIEIKEEEKEGSWGRVIINIALKILKKKTKSGNDQEDEELIKDILREVDKLRKK